MKTAVALLLFSVAIASAYHYRRRPMCPIPLKYSPVCGSDGKTYDNRQALECQQKADKDLTKLYNGQCKAEDRVQRKNKAGVCPIPNIFAPVCGSNGQTYSNRYEVQCQQRTDPDLKVAYQGPCQDTATEAADSEESPACACPRINDPVCGSNGVTYGNSCELKCQQQVNPGLTMVSKGDCQSKAEMKPCRCPRNLSPVCGSDGQTYANKCLLECQKSKYSSLSMRSNGPCEGGASAEPQPDPAVCACPRMLRPVCATDGQTYSNKCLLDCQTKKNPDVKLSYNGNCQGSSQPQVFPVAQPQVDPIPQPQVFPVAQPQVDPIPQPQVSPVQRPHVDSMPQPQVFPMPRPQVFPMPRPQVFPMPRPQVFPMPRPQVFPMLRPQVDPMPQPLILTDPMPQTDLQPNRAVCACPRILRPVCATDGQTYSNQCLLDCQTKKNPDIKLSYNGNCQARSQPQVDPMPQPPVDSMPQPQVDPMPQPPVDSMPQPPVDSMPIRPSVCPCPRILRPVCGTDGQTYSNQCLLNCQAKKHPDLKTSYDGPCEDKTEPELQPDDACICPMNFAPVCGSDGQTYPNRCTLQCQTTKDKDLSYEYSGPCRQS